MYRVLVGSISPEGEHLLTGYLEKFLPGTQLSPLKAQGIKGTLRREATKQDVVLVILDDMLAEACRGVAALDAILTDKKVHIYESDEGLKQFLVAQFGPLDDVEAETGTVPPDMLMGQEAPEDEFIPKVADLAKTSATDDTPPPGVVEPELPAMVDDEFSTVEEQAEISPADAPSEVVEKLESKVRDLQSQLAGKEALVRSLTQQVSEKVASEEGDIAAMAKRIRELQQELADKEAQLSSSGTDAFVNLGKVAHAEKVIAEFDELKATIKTLTEEKGAAEQERNDLTEKLNALQTDVDGLREQVATIPDLKASIDEKAKRVSSLEQELDVKSAIVQEMEASVSDHEGVVSELAQQKAELEVLQQQLNADKVKLEHLDELEDELAAKQLTIDNLQADISAADEKLAAQKFDLESLREDLKEKGAALEDAQRSLEECREDLRAKTAELSACAKERDDALAKINESSEYSQTLVENTQSLGQRISELTDELEAEQGKVATLSSKLTSAESEIAGLNQRLEDALKAGGSSAAQVTELQGRVEELEGEVGDLNQQLTDKTEECTWLSRQLGELRNSASASSDELRQQIEAKNTEITGLNGQLAAKNDTVAKLTTDITGLHEQLALKDGEITQIREQLTGVRQQLLDAQSSGSEAAIAADTQKQALEKVLSEKQELEDKLVEAETGRIELENKIRALEEELNKERDYRGSVDTSNVELTAQNEKLTNTVRSLEDSLVKAKADEEMVTRLEGDLLEERRRSARLQSEVDVMKKTRATDKSSDLRIEIARLQGELTSLQSSTVSADEAEAVKAELVSAREHAAKLELDLVAKDNQISQISSSVFSQLRNIAIPKGAYDFKFGQLRGTFGKCICIASGSEESTTNVYQVLRSACTAQNKRTVIVDLVTDSSIDKEFGIKRITSPIEWLNGNQQFQTFLADTRYGHVRVLSTALAYINDLFLMTVDWQSRLTELEAFSADTIVLYVGCLNNLVTKVLFDMFSRVMTTYVVVKATPVNLRTTILNLTGFKELSSTVTVECVNFSDTSSADMYRRLVAKYRAQILRDNEVLKLQGGS